MTRSGLEQRTPVRIFFTWESPVEPGGGPSRRMAQVPDSGGKLGPGRDHLTPPPFPVPATRYRA